VELEGREAEQHMGARAQAAMSLRNRRADTVAGYVFISPWLAGFLFFVIIPIIASLYLAFTHYDILSPPRWIGLSNFGRMFTRDPKFWQSVKVTFITVIVSVPLRLAFALAIALLLNTRARLVALYRALFYLPSLIGGSVAVAVMWRQLFGNEGAVNAILGRLGVSQRISWLGDPRLALGAIILLMVWQFGSSMLIFLAGLKNIPAAYVEAATVDGARGWQRLTRVVLPLLSPVILFNLVMQTIGSFLVFTPAYIVTGGGPLDATLVYALYLYQRGFEFFDMGFASAMAWVILIVIGGSTALIFRSSSAWVYYEAKGDRA
jgi:multiple sugar transport system permease protein